VPSTLSRCSKIPVNKRINAQLNKIPNREKVRSEKQKVWQVKRRDTDSMSIKVLLVGRLTKNVGANHRILAMSGPLYFIL
jgi:hypothetical protein